MAHIPNPYFLLDLEHRKDMPLDVAKSIDLINEVKSDGKIAYFCSADGPFAAWIKKAVRDESLHNGNWTDRDIPVQDQGPHKSCWSTSGSENISDARHIHGVDMEYTPYSGQYLMDFVDLEAAKKRLNSSNGNHYCYGYSTFLALVYAMRHGMPTRDNWKGVGCGRKNFPDGNLGDVRLKHVLNDVKIFGDVNKACDYLRIQPILGSLAIFKPDFSTVEDGIYRGPQSPESKFSSWHSVSIRSITVEDGETIAFVKNSHGLKSGVDGYIKVSMDVVLMELKNDETPFFLSPGRLFRSFTYGEVRAEYEKEVVEWYIDGEKKDDQVTGSEKTASLILEGIFNNTFGKVYENEDGENEIVGSPTDRAIFKWAIQLQLRMNFLYSKNGSSTIRGSPCNSKSKCRGVVVNVKTRHTEGIRVHWIGNAKFLLGKCTQYDSNGENLHLSETKETELKDAINDMAARKLFCIAIAFTEISKKDMPRTSSARKQWVLPCENLTLLAIFGIKNPCLLGEDETQAPLDFEDEVEPDGNRARFALVDRVDMVDNAICPSISQGLKKFAIWTIGAVDNSEEKLNYDQVFMRHFVPSSLVFLKNKEPETVRNYILKTKSLCLQSWEKQIDRFQLGEGAMPASLKDSSRFFSRMMPEKTIITSETSNSSPLNPSSSRIICHVCNKQFSQYTCPRCNFRYCSLPCYKSHSVQYTESFMKENVNGELRQVRSDDQTKMKMLEILKRFHEEEEDEEIDSITDDEGWILPEEIIQKVMNGDEVSLDDLSLEERKGFQRALASGELSKMIQPWDPWWLRAEARSISLGVGGTQLVQCVEEEDEKEEATTDVSEIPRGPDTPLISLSKLSSTNPSPFLPLHLIDIVYSYCFTLRIYNGEWQSDSLGSATMVLSVSSVLGHNAQPETIKEVLSFCLEQTCSSAYKNLGGGLKFGLNLVDDVICLLSLGSGAMVCLLCDLQRLIHGAIQEVKSGRDLKKKLKLAERKVFFMMCWVNEQSSEVCQALESSVRAEKNSVVELNDCKGVPKMKKKDQFRKGGGVVIEEIE